jgi:eukaryotic-like serine/threonine-protein kinase
MTHTLPGPLSDATSTTSTAANDAGNDASFAATVVEELFVEGEEGDSVPAVDSGDEALQLLPTLSHVGRYLLKHQLGSGGLGAVYAALDPLLSRQVAVKMLHVAEIDSAERGVLESQLLAEARAAAGLAHPNIVTMYDAGLAAEGVYIAMERLQGKDVRQLLADGWRPDAVQAARIGKRLADALAYAHGKGVVHCDIKPANIFMVGRTQPKVLDFGIARVTRRRGRDDGDAIDIDTGSLGATPAELGSPYYVSPEQLRGEELDARADVYGVGVVMYEMLTGQRAFGGGSLDEIRDAVQNGEVPSAHEVNPKVDRALSDIVARAMARKPGDRFRSARQLSRALSTWISEETNGLVHQPPANAWRRLGGWVWAGGGALAVGFIAAVWWLAPHQQAAAPDTVAVAPAPAASPAPAPVAEAPKLAAMPAPLPPAEAAAVSVPPTAPAPAASAPVIKPRAETTRTAAAKAKPAAKEKAPPTPAEPAPVAAAAPGVLQLAVTPWGQVEVDGRAMGTTPPLTRLTLPAGAHQIVVRNGDYPAHTVNVTVGEDKPVTLRHRFE